MGQTKSVHGRLRVAELADAVSVRPDPPTTPRQTKFRVTTMPPPDRPPLSSTGRVFAIAAFVEAFTWAGLLAGMFLKYVTETTDEIVSVFGALHGGMFLIYLVVTIVAGIILRWRWWEIVLTLLAAIPPLVTILAEVWLRRRGSLAAPADRSAARSESGREQVPTLSS